MINEMKTLKGLPGVRVVVESFSRAAEDAGFDTSTFQQEVELKLRLAGIRAYEDSEADWPPLLYVNVNALHGKAGERHAYGISLRLLQRAVLRRHLSAESGKAVPEDEMDDLTAEVVTWSKGATGFGHLPHVRDSVKDLADSFINAWLAANPRDGSPTPPV